MCHRQDGANRFVLGNRGIRSILTTTHPAEGGIVSLLSLPFGAAPGKETGYTRTLDDSPKFSPPSRTSHRLLRDNDHSVPEKQLVLMGFRYLRESPVG
jgi:hypothetical protein